MKKHLVTLLAIISALAMAGCSAIGNAPADGGSAITNGTGSAPSAGKFEGTDIGGKKESFLDKIGGMLGDDTLTADAGGALFATDAEGATDGINAGICFEPEDYVTEIPPQSGLLTGGEWNDNSHWADWNALYGSHEVWTRYKDDWRIADDYRLTVTVTADGKPLAGAAVNWNGNSAVTDNKGKAYLFLDETPSSEVTVTCGDKKTELNAEWVTDAHDLSLSAEMDGAVSPTAKKLDLMIMCDTTGSMSDELEYLKVELEDIVKSIKSGNANIPTRVSVNFYRDTEDEYEVRQFPFSENIDEVSEAIREQSAGGGGDFPEAVHTALDSAVNKHDWNADSVKIMFLVLDAPPHDDAQIVDSVNKYIAQAAEKGIRIVPVASSGIDKSTEYLLRAMAFTTGGTYTFLTDDSGVGSGHIEPTVGAYNVEKLKDMMIRIVNGYLSDVAAAEPVKTNVSAIAEDYLNNELSINCTVVDCDFQQYDYGITGGMFMYTFKCAKADGSTFTASYQSNADLTEETVARLVIKEE